MITAILCVDNNNLLGVNNKIVWSKKEDMKRFREITSGGVVIMGRKTYESIGRPLPKRDNFVVTRFVTYGVDKEGITCFNSLQSALDEAKKLEKNIFIIGGAEIYREAIVNGLVDIVDLTVINETFSVSEKDEAVYFDPKWIDCNENFHYEKTNSWQNTADPSLTHSIYTRTFIPSCS